MSQVSENGGRLACPKTLQPAPGQYLLAWAGDPCEPVAYPLFPASLPGEDLELAPPLPPAWLPGTSLHLRGPLGRGFNLPRPARRVVLAARAGPPALLVPLAHLALSQGAAVAFVAANPPYGLPQEVEILPPDLLAETLPWADALFSAFPLAELAGFRRQAGIRIHQRFPCSAEVLVLTPLPCSGLASCGVCAVPTLHGWKLACEDGPVFNLNELELL